MKADSCTSSSLSASPEPTTSTPRSRMSSPRQGCGYCASRVDQGGDYEREIVESEAYRAQLFDDRLPELASSFLCSALIHEELGHEAAAAHEAIRAAWVCDDEGAASAGVRCRLRAVELARDSEAEGDALFDDMATEYAVVADLLRRAGRFDDAVVQIDRVLAEAEDELKAVLAFLRTRSVARDPAAYTVEDALAPQS